MMKQFYELKAKNPDAVMLFRCGDFYETYCEDAVTASKILGITLTKRNNKGQAAAIDMAGFPFHALDTYLPKLIRAGHRVAICDQLEDPKTTNKLVKRGITELVTPGVSMNDNVLNCKENNFLAAINFGRSTVGLSLLDISTGEFLVAEGVSDYIEKLLSNFSPKEVLYERGKKKMFESCFGNNVLDEIPANEKHRQDYINDFLLMSKALKACQRTDGFWNVSLHDAGNYGGKETTGTALFVYGMAWGVRNGLLDKEEYLPILLKGWNAMVKDAVHSNGFLGYVQGTGKEPKDGQPVTYESVPDFEDYGVGCFLLAGTEIYKLQ